ncbi:MAG: hypothetical protein NXI20_04450 [bacterium]|nr:hypothetical protein [bacterium]
MINGIIKTALVLLPLSGLNQGELNTIENPSSIQEVFVDQNSIDREFFDYKIFLDEKHISKLPEEIKIKKIKKYKNSLIS